MENEQTLQSPTETTENPIMKHIALKETGDGVNQYSQNQDIKTEEVDEAENSTNSQVSFKNLEDSSKTEELLIIGREEILVNSVDNSDEIILSSPRDDSESDQGLLNTQIVLNSVGRSPSTDPDVDLEAGKDPPQSPCWRSTYLVIMEAIDYIVAVLAFALEVAQIMSNDNKPLKWVVLGFTVVSSLITWTMFTVNAWQKNARFSFGCFILPNGKIYESICKYIESYTAVIQVVLSIITIIVKFPKRLIFSEIIISSAMISSKLTARCSKSE